MLFVPNFPVLFTLHALPEASNTLWPREPAVLPSHRQQRDPSAQHLQLQVTQSVISPCVFYPYYMQVFMQSSTNPSYSRRAPSPRQ